MSTLEILSIIATLAGVACFAAVFTILYSTHAKSTVAQIESGKRDIELIDEALKERIPKVKRNKKIISGVKTALFVLFLAIAIPAFIFSLVTRIADGRPIFGKTFLVVASGSMSYLNEENKYHDQISALEDPERFDRYDIIILDKVDSPADLKAMDIVAYRNEQGYTIIHRIVKIEGHGADTVLTTCGDANEAEDPYHATFSDIVGVYRGTHAKGVGIVIMFLQSYSGIITVVALLYCLIMVDAVSRKIEKCEEARRGKLLGAIEGGENAAKEMRAEFKETIYYKGFAYRFDEKGFIDKRKIEDGEAPEEDTMVKVIEEGENTSSESIFIESKKLEEKKDAEDGTKDAEDGKKAPAPEENAEGMPEVEAEEKAEPAPEDEAEEKGEPAPEEETDGEEK